ncbi:MAG: serine/threonine protein kinase [Verrucomicrobiales bacterium]|nr:serine/threonine protein kinase [Verrucomicrobiales bacterium]
MESKVPSSGRSSRLCPACGWASVGLLGGAVCPRCAAERVLRLEGLDLPRSDSSMAVETEAEAVPSRIGEYEVVEEIGRGGMGRVYAARQGGLGRLVALKVMGDGRCAPAPGLETRFLREAQTAASLRHSHIVAVHDFGRAGRLVYFSMDYHEDGDLAKRLRNRPFMPREAALLMRKVADALAFAHSEGVLHRDLKPSNILLDGDEPKLADFGLAVSLEARGQLTRGTDWLGTPQYVAPEGLRLGSRALTAQSDVYALGVVLFELLTGRTPFAGTTPAGLLSVVEAEEPPSLRLLSAAVPRDLETLCLKCLEKEPRRRYASAAAVAEDLRRFLADMPLLARPASSPERFLRWCRRRPALAGVWVLVTLLAAGSTAAAFLLASARDRARAAETDARERLRDARLAESKALLRTTEPGRRARALEALREAAAIRAGPDLRDQVVAALLTADVRAEARWELPAEAPGEVTVAPTGAIACFETRDPLGHGRKPGVLRNWGETNVLARLSGSPTNALGSARFSRDGSKVMWRFHDDCLRVWLTGESRPLLELRDRPAPSAENQAQHYNNDYDFTPDGTALVLGLGGGGVTLNAIPDGREIARWAGDRVIHFVRMSADGRHFAASSRGPGSRSSVMVIRCPELTLECTLEMDSPPTSLAWSADGHLLAVTRSDSAVEVYGMPQGRLRSRLHSVLPNPIDVWFLGDDSLLAFRGWGSTLDIVDPVVGRLELEVPGLGASAVTVPRGGAWFAVTAMPQVPTRWTLDRPLGRRMLPPPSPTGYGRSFNNACLDFSPDARQVVSSHGPKVLVRETRLGRVVAEATVAGASGLEESGIAFGDGGRTLVRLSNQTGLGIFRIEARGTDEWTLDPGRLTEPAGEWYLTDHTPDGRRLACVVPRSGRVRVLEIAGGELRVVGDWVSPGAYSAALSPDGARVLVNTAGEEDAGPPTPPCVYAATGGPPLVELPAEGNGEATWSADGSVAMTSNGPNISILWDTATWRARARLDGTLGGNTTTFALSTDGTWAVVVAEQRVQLVTTRGGTRVVALDSPGAGGLASAVRFVPGSCRVGVLWREGRLDLCDFEALRAGAAAYGVGW